MGRGNGFGNSLAVQWLGFRAFTAEGAVSIPGQGTKIPPKKKKNGKEEWLHGKEMTGVQSCRN